MILAADLLFVMGTLMCYFCTSIESLFGGRLVVGCGIGIMMMVNPVFLSESLPQPIRGQLTSTFTLLLFAGISGGYIVSIFLEGAW
jgi:SP family facilitated glucose transporter-like MFS transporter 8